MQFHFKLTLNASCWTDCKLRLQTLQ